MSFKDTGGFDVVMEVAQQLLLEVAGAITFPSQTIDISFEGISGPLTIVARVDQIALGTFPFIELSIDFTGTTFVATSVPAYLSPVPVSLRTIEMEGDATIAVPLKISMFTLVADFTEAGTAVPSQALLDSIFAAPLIEFALAEAILFGGAGGFAAAKGAIVAAFADRLTSQIKTLGQKVLIDLSSLSMSLAGAIGQGLSAFNFGFGNQSIFLLLTIGGTPGILPTRSDLLRTTEGQPADRADLIISNACFLRDFMRFFLKRPVAPGGAGGLGLTPSGFLPPFLFGGAPFAWGGNVPFPPAVTGPIVGASITSVIVGIDGTNIRFLLEGTASGILGSFSVTASIDITVSLTAALSGNMLTFTFTPIGAPVVNSNVSIAWWVYLVGYLIGGFTVDVIIAVANAFGGNFANGIIAGLVAGAFSPISISVSLPQNVPPLSVRQTSMFQADAFPSMVIAGPAFFALPFPQNDIIIDFI